MASKRFLLVALALAGLQVPSIAPAQTFITEWGGLGSGNGQFDSPYHLAVDAAGNVYVADRQNSRIQKFNSTGTYLTQWGTNNRPWAVAADAAGNVFVADYGNSLIQKFTSTGTYLTQFGGPGYGNGQFHHPTGVATDAAGNLYVADSDNSRIQKFTSDGTYLTQWGSVGSGNGQFGEPLGIDVDAAGNVYVADSPLGPGTSLSNHRIQKFTSDGTYLTQWGTFGGGDGQFFFASDVAADAAGNVYVADSFNHRIQKFTGDGTYLTQWGSVGSGNGQFEDPYGVATDADGNIYVADPYNHLIQKFGYGPTPVASVTWGSMKARYRGAAQAATQAH